MQFLLVDGPERQALLPFTHIRPVAHLRLGIDRLIDKWEAALDNQCGVLAHASLQEKFPIRFDNQATLINPAFIPTSALAKVICSLSQGQALRYGDQLVACRVDDPKWPTELSDDCCIHFEEDLYHLRDKTDLFLLNDDVLRSDFVRLTKGRLSQPISSTNQVIGSDQIFIEEGAWVECATLNANTGPIYIGKNAEIMEGSLLRGSLAICDHAVVKMGAKIYGGTTVGPYSKVGGELNNVLILGYSNKGHDGFLGNAVIGEWCNIGAATDASNLKNSYAQLRVWDYEKENFAKTKLQFCGLLMGDYSRCGIHSMFNTATVIGVCANLFGAGFPRTFLPSFSFGGAQGLKTNGFDKAMEANEAMMARRGKQLTPEDRKLLKDIFDQTSKWRRD